MNKLEKLHEMRKKAGITFTKSFNCQDAEKNIHLVDKDKFFKKFVKKLNDMGYEISYDFTFDIIRHKYPYAERHHIGKTYEWKYFYSTTFEISQEMIDFLERHLFIIKKEDLSQPKSSKELKKEKKKEQIIELELKRDEYKEKIRQFNSFMKSDLTVGNTTGAENYKRAIERIYRKIENLDKRLTKLH